MPFRGAYCAEIDFGTSATDSYFLDPGNFAASASSYFRFMLYLSPDLTMANADEMSIFDLRSGTTTLEAGVFLNFTTASGFRLGIGEATATSLLSISTGVWHTVEFTFLIDSGACDTGTLDMFLDGSAATQVTGTDQAAITDWRFGSQVITGSSATAGYILLDELVEEAANTATIPTTERYPDTLFMHETGHAFVGPGWIDEVQLLPAVGAADNVIIIYDTNQHEILDRGNIVTRIAQDATTTDRTMTTIAPYYVKRGAYVEITGTAAVDGPWALVKVRPKYRSEGAITQFGRTLNV